MGREEKALGRGELDSVPLTNRFYGATSVGAGRTIQDFGLCDIKGAYTYTTKVRAKGMLVATFLTPDAAGAGRAAETVQAWTTEVPMDKWSAIAVASGDRDAVVSFAEQHGLANVSTLVDHGAYQTRVWGISRLPVTFLIAGKTGQILGRVVGDDAGELAQMKEMLTVEIAKVLAAEEAAKEAARLAEEAKKAAEAAKAAEEAAKPAEPAKA
jgi:hypothetical protein